MFRGEKNAVEDYKKIFIHYKFPKFLKDIEFRLITQETQKAAVIQNH